MLHHFSLFQEQHHSGQLALRKSIKRQLHGNFFLFGGHFEGTGRSLSGGHCQAIGALHQNEDRGSQKRQLPGRPRTRRSTGASARALPGNPGSPPARQSLEFAIREVPAP